MFLVNVPIAALALLLVTLRVPTSRDAMQRPFDPVGGALSIAGLVALVYGLIQGPEFGWTDGAVIGAFIAAAVFLTGWVRVELAHADPMLDPRLFKLRPFSIGSFTITSSFLVMFGMFFVLTQYLQFVLGYTALQAAVRTLPFALTMVAVAPRGPTLVQKLGRSTTISTGMLIAASGAIWLAILGSDASYIQVLGSILLLSGGMALVFPAATELIVGSLPQDKAGVASAMNDTTREVGGAIGIALLGTLLSVGYRDGLGSATDPLPPDAAEAARDNIGAALAIAAEAPGGEFLALAARDAYVDGKRLAMFVGAAVFVVSAMIVRVVGTGELTTESA